MNLPHAHASVLARRRDQVGAPGREGMGEGRLLCASGTVHRSRAHAHGDANPHNHSLSLPLPLSLIHTVSLSLSLTLCLSLAYAPTLVLSLTHQHTTPFHAPAQRRRPRHVVHRLPGGCTRELGHLRPLRGGARLLPHLRSCVSDTPTLGRWRHPPPPLWGGNAPARRRRSPLPPAAAGPACCGSTPGT